jgi:hypothetical protein
MEIRIILKDVLQQGIEINVTKFNLSACDFTVCENVANKEIKARSSSQNPL